MALGVEIGGSERLALGTTLKGAGFWTRGLEVVICFSNEAASKPRQASIRLAMNPRNWGDDSIGIECMGTEVLQAPELPFRKRGD